MNPNSITTFQIEAACIGDGRKQELEVTERTDSGERTWENQMIKMLIVFIPTERLIKRDIDEIDETAKYAVYVVCDCGSN